MNHPRTFGKVEIKLAVMENQMTVACIRHGCNNMYM
jgi:hypothetical protein